MKSPSPEELQMHNEDDTADTLGLHFFGNMTASISHEIKNALAIINENGGLLGDLVLLMEKGRPLDPERLKTMSGNIRRQVQRADDIIRRLNRFAHSAHEPATSIDVREIFDFTTALAARLATMKGVSMTIAPGPPVQMEVRPFQLENLLWLCLKHLFVVTEVSQSVEFAVEESGADILICLRFGTDLPVAEIGARVAREGQPLLAALQAELRIDTSVLQLKMPKKLED
jgi:signal transduction histidine kinase